MKDWCPFCGKPCEVDEVDLSQYEHDVIKKFLGKKFFKDTFYTIIINFLKDLEDED